MVCRIKASPQTSHRKPCSFPTFSPSQSMAVPESSSIFPDSTKEKVWKVHLVLPHTIYVPVYAALLQYTVHIYTGDEGEVRCKDGLGILVSSNTEKQFCCHSEFTTVINLPPKAMQYRHASDDVELLHGSQECSVC